jgi:hypothetical protein
MPNLPKTFNVPKKQFTTMTEAQSSYNDLIKQIDFMFRQVRADLEKIEKRLTDGGL